MDSNFSTFNLADVLGNVGDHLVLEDLRDRIAGGRGEGAGAPTTRGIGAGQSAGGTPRGFFGRSTIDPETLKDFATMRRVAPLFGGSMDDNGNVAGINPMMLPDLLSVAAEARNRSGMAFGPDEGAQFAFNRYRSRLPDSDGPDKGRFLW